MAHLRILSDDELLRHAQIEFDPLTGTALEAELMRRFEENAATSAENEPLLKLLADHGVDSTDALDKVLKQSQVIDETPGAQALLDALSEFDIDDPEQLKKQLDRMTKFDEVMNDLAQPLATLQTLVPTE